MTIAGPRTARRVYIRPRLRGPLDARVSGTRWMQAQVLGSWRTLAVRSYGKGADRLAV